MNALVVYESLYGNTRKVADAIAEGLRDAAHVDVVAVSDASASSLASADILVVGGPTHIHGLTSTLSRKGANDDAGKKGCPSPTWQGRHFASGSTASSDRSMSVRRPRSTRASGSRSSSPARPQAASPAASAATATTSSPRRASSSTTPPARCTRANSNAPARGATPFPGPDPDL
jgi:hypothetical protein